MANRQGPPRHHVEYECGVRRAASIARNYAEQVAKNQSAGDPGTCPHALSAMTAFEIEKRILAAIGAEAMPRPGETR